MADEGGNDELRDYLRRLKDEAGLSFASIAAAIGEDERTVKRWFELKDPKVPRGDALLRLLPALGVRVEPSPDGAPQPINIELRELRNIVAHAAALIEQRAAEGADPEAFQAMTHHLRELAETVDGLAQTVTALQGQVESLASSGAAARRARGSR